MPKSIIVPLDGSLRADAAIATAGWMATALDAELTLTTTTFAADTSTEEAMLAQAQRLAHAPSVRTVVLEHSFPANGIERLAAELPDPLICMTTHGHGGFGSTLLGSVSRREVLRSRVAPVVLVGPAYHDVLDDPQDMVVCVAEPTGRDALVAASVPLASSLGLRLHEVRIVDDEHGTVGPTTFPAPVTDPRIKLGLTIDVRRGDLSVDDVAVALGRGLDAALLVVASPTPNPRSHGSAERVTTEIVRHSRCPVLVQPVTSADP